MKGKRPYIGAIDQGTTSTRFFVFNRKAEVVATHQMEHRQFYPRPGWVEHDPVEIRDKTFETISRALSKSGIKARELAAVGITNQRETTVAWNRKTGEPYGNAIVWQDTRTNAMCRELAENNDMWCFRDRVGLPLSTYFSGPKMRWMIEHTDGLRRDIANGTAVFGNIDSWLIWWLTGGPGKGAFVTDVTNAGRTMLMNINTLQWDATMLDIMGVPETALPAIRSSSEIYGYSHGSGVFGAEIPVAGDLGDQQAALFGQTCFAAGEAKNTYGTGCFLLLNTGSEAVQSDFGLLTTPAYKIGDDEATYALEGSIAIAGSLVQWFRDNMGMIRTAPEIEDVARQVDDNGGVYIVPAFSGLFAPHWRSDAEGIVTGLTHYASKGHLARAVLEACAFQVKDIIAAMEKDSSVRFSSLKVDGGMTANELLMQFQSDILDIPVIRPANTETTVLGAAYAAGLATGFWRDFTELRTHWKKDRTWNPGMLPETRKAICEGWAKAIVKSCA